MTDYDHHIQAAQQVLADFERGVYDFHLRKALVHAQIATAEATREQTAVLRAALLPDAGPLLRLPGAGPATASDPREAAPVPPPRPGASG